MALKLFAVLIVLAGLVLAPQWSRYREWRWFDAWLRQLDGSAGLSWVLLAVVAPALLAALISVLLHGAAFGLLSLAFALLVLALCLYELEPDIDAVLKAGDRTQRENAARALYDDPAAAAQPLDPPTLIEATVMAALHRRFGVLFWFFLLGPAGALLFHLGHRGRRTAAQQSDADAIRVASKLSAALDWLPAHLMALAMALASDFDAVIGAWRQWHADPTRTAWEFEPGFLGAIARASVNADVDAGEVDSHAGSPVELANTKRLLLRVLVIWLAAVAVIVLAGWVA